MGRWGGGPVACVSMYVIFSETQQTIRYEGMTRAGIAWTFLETTFLLQFIVNPRFFQVLPMVME